MPTQYASVAEFLDALSPQRRSEAEALRSIVTAAHPGLVETIKWNSPNYSLGDTDLLTMNVPRSGALRLILHRGTSHAEDKGAAPEFDSDPTGLLTWHSNIRASLRMPASDAPASAHDDMVAVVRAWVESGAS